MLIIEDKDGHKTKIEFALPKSAAYIIGISAIIVALLMVLSYYNII